MNATNKNRVYYIDYLKVFLMMLVIMLHSILAYTANDWPFHDGDSYIDVERNIALLRGFFMGMYFLLAGSFLARSVERYNLGQIIVKKFERLGFPVLFILLVLTPIDYYVVARRTNEFAGSFMQYFAEVYVGQGRFNYGHGWFLVVLFFLSVIYAVYYHFFGRRLPREYNLTLNLWLILGTGIISGVLNHIVRAKYELNQWVSLLGFIGIEPAHIWMYIIMFAFGIIGGKCGWFRNINKRLGLVCTAIAIVLSALYCFADAGRMTYSGLYLELWDVLESVYAMAISIGLMYIAERFIDRPIKSLQSLAGCYYSAYIFHITPVILLQVAFSYVEMPVQLKCTLVCVLAIIVSFILGYLFEKVKNVRKV